MSNGLEEFESILDSVPMREDGPQGMQQDPDFLSVLLSKDEILHSNSISSDIKSILRFYNKTLALSNIGRSDIHEILEGLDDAKVAYIMGRPKGSFTWQDELEFTMLRNWVEIEATRGVDGFERTMEATQIHQSTVESKNSNQNRSGGISGFFSKIAGGGRD